MENEMMETEEKTKVSYPNQISFAVHNDDFFDFIKSHAIKKFRRSDACIAMVTALKILGYNNIDDVLALNIRGKK